jgi:alpha-glucoside transport system permease protein
MEGMAGQKSSLTWSVNIAALLLVILWTIPTFGLFVSSFRDRDQISTSGWWNSFSAQEQTGFTRTGTDDDATQEGGLYVLEGSLVAEGQDLIGWGTSARNPIEFAPGTRQTIEDGWELSVNEDGSYRLTSATPFEMRRGERIFTTTSAPPKFTLANYTRVLTADGIGRAFINTATVTIPATIIPILIAAFAAYALAWMRFPGRALIMAVVVGLLVVPLQVALIPLLRFHNEIGIGKGYLGIWLAHTGFGLPLAIYLLRSYMAGLPREVIESARVDGATEFQIFRKIILPLSFPALASFSIFQFLWTWNDLLVATVFLGNTDEQRVMTAALREMMGSRGGEWEILATSAFISISVPLLVFFAMQRYLVRGLLAGSVK